MRIRIICSMMALLAGMGTALAQGPSTPASGSPPGAVKLPATGPDSAPALMPGADGNVRSTDPAISELATEPGVGMGAAASGVVPYQFYGSMEYLLWKIKDAPAPPTQLTIPFTISGLNQEQTALTIPGNGVDYGSRSGVRASLGYFFDADRRFGLEGSFFEMERRDGSFITSQQANLQLNVTVVQNIATATIVNGAVVNTITQTPINVALPSTLTVSASGSAGPTDFWGFEVNGRSHRWDFGGLSIDFAGGFRCLNLAEEFNLNESIILQTANPNTVFVNGAIVSNAQLNGVIPVPVSGLNTVTATQSYNAIGTRNTFYGANLSAYWDWRFMNRLSFQGYGKIAMGPMVENFTITAITSTSTGTGGSGGTNAQGGGVLPAVGFLDQGRTRLAVIPELNFTCAWHWTENIRSTFGFNFLYINSVMRPGDQLQFNSSNTQINISGTQNNVATVQPAFVPKDTNFWAQGVTCGLEFRY